MTKRLSRPMSAVAACGALLLAAGLAAWVMTPDRALAHSYTLGDIFIGHIWAKPPEKGVDGVPVYAPFLNNGPAPVQLVGASSPIADKVRFRVVAKDGTVQWAGPIELLPGKPFALAAWRQHIWLSGLHKPLKDGDWFDLTLDFGAKGKLPVKVHVETTPGH
jgi:periplasmic copper chaperone A